MEGFYWNLHFADLTTYMLVFGRMSGMLLFNPVLARRNVPARFRVALLLGLTLLLAPNVSSEALHINGAVGLVFSLMLEIFVGFICGFVFILFYYMLFFAGDFLDVEFGLSMAKVFDPGSNIQMSLSSTLFNVIFCLYFFITDSHLLLIKLFSSSYLIVPMGGAVITEELATFFIQLFCTSFSLTIRLTLPFVAAMFTSEVAMGVLMKLVPQIHVFVISMQFKILLGLLLMLLFASPIVGFLDTYLTLMFENMEKVFYVLAG